MRIAMRKVNSLSHCHGFPTCQDVSDLKCHAELVPGKSITVCDAEAEGWNEHSALGLLFCASDLCQAFGFPDSPSVALLPVSHQLRL